MNPLHKNSASTIILGFMSGAAGALVVVILMASAFSHYPAMMNTLMIPDYSRPAAVDQQILAADNHQDRVVEVVKNATPAVVSIVISKDVPVVERYYENNPFGDLFPFNFQIPQYRQNGTEKKQVGGGSGFLVSADGYIITNKHVVSESDAEYTVFTSDGKKHTAEVLAKDPVQDLAIIKVRGADFPYLSFGNSDSLKVGQSVIAVGNALGEFRNTVSVGVVSGLARSITAGDNTGNSELLEGVIQTDAAINPGNSGGPLLDLSGAVIGVNVAVAQGSENIGFSIPSNTAKGIVESVRKTGKIVRPFLGVRYVQITEALKEKNQLPVDYGALVVRGGSDDEVAVTPGSPADKAGIVENDIILEVDGVKLDEGHSLAAIVRQGSVGDDISVKILHKGEEKTLSVTLGEIPQ